MLCFKQSFNNVGRKYKNKHGKKNVCELTKQRVIFKKGRENGLCKTAIVTVNMVGIVCDRAGRSSGGRALTCKGWDHPSDRACMACAFAVWAIFPSNQSTTDPSKAVVCAVLSVKTAVYWKE